MPIYRGPGTYSWSTPPPRPSGLNQVFNVINQYSRGFAHPFSTLGSGLIHVPQALYREAQNKPINDIQKKVFGTNNSGKIAKQILGDTAVAGSLALGGPVARGAETAAAGATGLLRPAIARETAAAIKLGAPHLIPKAGLAEKALASAITGGAVNAAMGAGGGVAQGQSAKQIAKGLPINTAVGVGLGAAAPVAGAIARPVLRGTAQGLNKATDAMNAHPLGAKLNSIPIGLSIKDTGKGKIVSVDKGQHLFDNKPPAAHPAIARKYLNDNFKGKTLQIDDGGNVTIGKRGIGKYTNPYQKNTPEIMDAKMRLTPELDNAVRISKLRSTRPDVGGVHGSLAKDGFDYRSFKFEVGGKQFVGTLNIGKNGEIQNFYDVHPIKKAPGDGLPSQSIPGTSPSGSSGSGVNRSIAAEIPKSTVSSKGLPEPNIPKTGAKVNKPNVPEVPKYLYHGTGVINLDSIAKEGLRPGRRGQLSLSKDEAYSRKFAESSRIPAKPGQGVMLRVNADMLKGKTKPGKGPVSDQLNELLTKETIPPQYLEIQKNGKWQPLTPPTQGVKAAIPAPEKPNYPKSPKVAVSDTSGEAPGAPKQPESAIPAPKRPSPAKSSTKTSEIDSASLKQDNTTKIPFSQQEQMPKDFLQTPGEITKPGKDSIQREAERITAEDREKAKLLGISPQRARTLRLRPPVPPELNGPVNAKLAGITPKIDELPQTPKGIGDLPPVNELKTSRKLLASKVTALRQIGGKSGNELADRMVAIDRSRRDLRANWIRQSKTALGLSDKDFEKAVDVIEGRLAFSKVSPQIQQAVKEMRKVLPDVHQAGTEQGLLVGDRGATYFPHSYPSHMKINKAQVDSALQWLMDTNQVDHQTATQLFADMKAKGAEFPNRFGNFENARLTDMPGYYKDKQAYLDYLDNAAKRISEAKYFGADNQIATKLLDNLRMEGGDHATASTAVANYLRSADRGIASKPLAAARGFFGAARLGKATISHVGQSTNTVVEAGVKNTLKGWGQFLSRNKAHRDFIAKTGVTNPSELHSYRDQLTSVKGALSKITAPLLTRTMTVNRSVTALAGRSFGLHLAEKGDISKLRELGVTGNIGKTLSESQQIQAARGLVDSDMFSGSRATTPIYAETPLGKTIGQYRTAYTYKQTGFIYNQVIKEARKGNLAPLARYLAISGAIGVGTIAVKNKISGREEGIGGEIMDAAAALGGLPGEAALQLARYGKKDLTKSIAGLVAPLAGEAVDLGERATQALQGKPQQLERYGLGLIPIVGSRVAGKVVPYAPGTNKAQVAQGAAQPQKGIYQVKAKDGSTKFTTLQSSKMTSFPNLKAAQTAQAKNEFKFSGKQTTTINGQQYHKTASGHIAQGPKPAPKANANYTYKLFNGQTVNNKTVNDNYTANTAKLSAAQKSGDLSGYTSTAKAQLNNISAQMNNPKITPTKAQQLANDAQTIQDNLNKYSSYGGFTRPTGAPVVKSIGTITGAKDGYISAIQQSAAKYGVDANAALAVASAEGLGGGVGDNGTSFGPFQLHIGGALPAGKNQAWAESPAGIDYALQTISKVAAGKTGAAAVQAIVNGFEKPANPSNEIQRALAVLGGGNATLSSGSPGSGTYTASASSTKASTTAASKALSAVLKANKAANAAIKPPKPPAAFKAKVAFKAPALKKQPGAKSGFGQPSRIKVKKGL